MLAQVNADFVSEVMLFVTFIFCGLLFIGLAVPMVLRKIPPNQFYGWRTPKAFSNKEIWYEINWYSGRDLVVMGVMQVVFNLVLLFVDISSKDKNLIYQLLVPGNLVILIGGTIIVVIRGFLHLRKL